MNYRWISLNILGLFLVSLLSSTALAAVQDTYFAYLLAPKTGLSINEELLENPNASALLVFQKADKEDLQVGPEQVGQRVLTNNYSVDIRKDASVSISHIFELNAGSIHVRPQEGNVEASEMKVADLMLSFTSAEFLAFVSGEGDEAVIKVIKGQVDVESPVTQQTASLNALEATSTDEEGRLLIPFPVEIQSTGAWWNAFAYKHDIPQVPIADAGDDQQALSNMSVTLDGSRSEFQTGDIFEWKLINAPKGSDGKALEKVSFNTLNIVKPVFTPKLSGEYGFSLQITDPEGVQSNTSTVKVFIGKEYLTPTVLFPDVLEEHPNNLAITYLYKKNVMRGSVDAETSEIMFRPEETINRVEILKTVFENLRAEIPKAEEIDEGLFLDVKPEHWFAPYVQLAKEKNIIKGNDGLYRPADEVILVEAIKIIVEASEINIDSYKDELSLPYNDTEKGAWYNPYLFFVKKYGLFDADKNGNIQPSKALSRAEFAEIIYRLESSNLQEKKGFISGLVIDSKTKKAISNAEVFIYKTLGETEEESFVEKGELFEKVSVNSAGAFTVTVPIHLKYYIEAITADNVSVNKVIIQVQEDEVERVELLIEEQ